MRKYICFFSQIAIALLLLCPLNCSAQLLDSAWPGFMHDTFHRSVSSGIGPQNGTSYRKIHIGGTGYGSVAIANGRIYAVGDGKLYAMEMDGSTIWTYQIGNTGWSTPAVDMDGTAYVASKDGILYAINSNGIRLWQYNLQGSVDASPTIGSDGSIYIGCSNKKFYGFTKGGLLKFTYSAGGAITSSAAIAPDSTIYFGCDDGNLYSLTQNGTLKRKLLLCSGYAIRSSPAISSEGTVYVGAMNGYMYAARPTDTKQYWCRATAGPVYSSPAISNDGYVYIGCQGRQLFKVNTINGSGQSILTTKGYVDSSPAIDAEGVVYVGSYDGSIYAVDRNGALKWSTDLGDPIASSPAIGGNGALYVLTTAGDLCIFASDSTPPATPAVVDDGSYSTNPSILHASWQSSDSESGIEKYEYAIGTSPGSQDVVSFTDAGQATEVTRYDLSLVNGRTYYFAVRATNGAGLVSETGVSDGIKVDTTPPVAPIVADDGDYTTCIDKLHVIFNSGDVESGISHYMISVGNTPDNADVLDWYNVGTIKDQTISGLSLVNGKTYYINVRAYNNAGLTSAWHSNGITVDTTAPGISALNVNATSEEIRVSVTAADVESGIDQVQYVLLTSPQLPDSPTWTTATSGSNIIILGPFMGGKSYYVAVKASNHAGLWCNPKISNEIRVDNTPPDNPTVTDDGQFQTSTSTLNASWSAVDQESGINHYTYCVGTAPNNSSIVKWTDTTQTSVSLTGLSLSNGVKYFVTVKAVNGGGLVSDAASSDGITIDATPPSTPVVTDDGDQTSISNCIHATWSAGDEESGIVEYYCCVGTSPGGSDVSEWKSVGSASSATIGNLELSLGIKYYVSVKAKNGAGEWGGVGASNGIEFKRGTAVWTKFRCDGQNSGTAPVSGSMTGRLSWHAQTQGYIESSAAIDKDGTAYVGSSDGKLYAITSTGQVKWYFQTGGYVDSSPAIGSNGNIYFGSDDNNLYCLNSDGTLKWKYTAGEMIWSSPVIASDGTLYFGCQDGCLYALSSEGALKWKYNTGSPVWSSPALDSNGNIFFGCGDGNIYSISPLGVLRWTYQTGSAVDSSPAVDSNNVVYIGSGDGYVYAINSDGTLRWRHFMQDIADASPAVTKDGRVYFGTGVVGPKGSLCAFNTDGTLLWKLDMPGGVRSSPAVSSDGTIYVGCTDGKVYAINANGQQIWSYKTMQSILASPAISGDGSVIIGSDDGNIYCFKDITSVDLTPPSQPVVTVNRLLNLGSALTASWVSSDAESGIQSYSYAIGTTPGGEDTVAWTPVGSATSVSRSDLTLKVGQTYYVSVKSKNYAGSYSGVGVSEAISVVLGDLSNTIGYAKKQPIDSIVHLQAKVVTAVFSDCVFVEDPTRASGIRCNVTGSTLTVGSIVDITGTLQRVYGELVIGNAVLQLDSVGKAISPVATCCDNLCKIGLDLTGQLVRVYGKVTYTGDGFIIIHDGCNTYSPRGAMGIEVKINLSSKPEVGSYVGVTGIPCWEVVSSRITKIIRAANDPQFTVYKAK